MTCLTRYRTVGVIAAIAVTWLVNLSAHVIKGLDPSQLVSAFLSSPAAGVDLPIKISWGNAPTGDTGLRVVCFSAANTSPARPDDPAWPRITGLGFELPGTRSGFSLLGPQNDDWELVEAVEAPLTNDETVTLDFAIVARVNPTGRTPGAPSDPRGIPPGQAGVRGSGTRFCVSGPFPDQLPNRATPDPADTIASSIEALLDGVVVAFQGAEVRSARTDFGVWFPSGSTGSRDIPLYP